MDRWEGKVAVVTGASSGIGARIAQDLVRAGMKVVGLARRVEKVEALRDDLISAKGELFARKCDVSKESEIQAAFQWVKETLGGTDVLVNNAGIFRYQSLTDPGNGEDIRAVMDTNVMGLCYCTREAFNSMKERNFDGHIIHISSVLAHTVSFRLLDGKPMMNVYPAAKYAVKALTETLRQEMAYLKSKVKVTSISPGLVDTEIVTAAGLPQHIHDEMLKANPSLRTEDISQAVLYVLGTPPHVQIHELTIKPLGEHF